LRAVRGGRRRVFEAGDLPRCVEMAGRALAPEEVTMRAAVAVAGEAIETGPSALVRLTVR